MRKHPAWLAAGLLLFAVLACNLSKNNNANNSNNSNDKGASADSDNGSGAAIKEIYMAKDDGSGQPGDHTSTFEPGDHTIHCVATLNESKAGTAMRFSWWIVEADNTRTRRSKTLTTAPRLWKTLFTVTSVCRRIGRRENTKSRFTSMAI